MTNKISNIDYNFNISKMLQILKPQVKIKTMYIDLRIKKLTQQKSKFKYQIPHTH